LILAFAAFDDRITPAPVLEKITAGAVLLAGFALCVQNYML
jgi:hypothetical protein